MISLSSVFLLPTCGFFPPEAKQLFTATQIKATCYSRKSRFLPSCCRALALAYRAKVNVSTLFSVARHRWVICLKFVTVPMAHFFQRASAMYFAVALAILWVSRVNGEKNRCLIQLLATCYPFYSCFANSTTWNMCAVPSMCADGSSQ